MVKDYTLDPADTYRRHEEYIRKLVSKFRKKYSGRFDDLLSIANLGFVKAYRSYNAEWGAAFETWLYECVWGEMLTTKRAAAIYAKRRKDIELETIEEVRHFSVKDFMRQLSKDAATAVHLTVNPTSRMTRKLKGEIRPSDLKFQLHVELRKMGWKQERIQSAFYEIQETL